MKISAAYALIGSIVSAFILPVNRQLKNRRKIVDRN